MEPPKQLVQVGMEKILPGGKFVEIGLSWDMYDEKIDLDLSVVMLTESGQLIDAVYFNKIASDDGSVLHSGDERTGIKEGDDEKITINLEKVSKGTKVFAVLVTSASGQSFQKIETAELTISVDKMPIISMNCGWQGDFHSIMSAFIYFNDDKWKIKNIGEVGHQRNFVDMLPQITSNMRFLVEEGTLIDAETWNSKTGKSFNLTKADEVKLPSCLNEIAMGLGWETLCDLDSSVITMDQDFKIKEYVYYGNKKGINNAIMHQGDNLTGEGKGDDENIVINLSKINSDIVYIGCILNVYTGGKSFSNVTDAYCRLIDWQSKAEFCKYKLNESGPKKACLMCYLKRDSPFNKWKIKATGVFFNEFNIEEIAKEIKLDVGIVGKIKGDKNEKLNSPANDDHCQLI